MPDGELGHHFGKKTRYNQLTTWYFQFHTDTRIMITQQNVQNCMASDYT